MDKYSKSELTKINEIPFFRETIAKLTKDELLSPNEQAYILSCSILFLRSYVRDNRFKTFAEFSYYIILKYAITYRDLRPLYDFSTSFGFYPITKAILANREFEIEKISDILLDFEVEKFRKESHIETIHQHVERVRMLHSKSSELGYIAPTSFGKSSVIIEYINKNSYSTSTIAIIVPTKSLLMQSYRMIRDANLGRKIIIHDEMYDGDPAFIVLAP